MLKFYDKVFLFFSVIALALGAGSFALSHREAGNLGDALPSELKRKEYPRAAVPGDVAGPGLWPSPQAQSSGWIYDVFTPPKIYLDQDGAFSAKPWQSESKSVQLDLWVDEVTRIPYRIQLQGYVEEDRFDSKEYWLFLYDEEREEAFRIRPGDEADHAQITVLDFKILREIDTENGFVEIRAEAIIRDHRSMKEVVLTEGELLYSDRFNVCLRSLHDLGVSIDLNELGQSFDWASETYSLAAIDFESDSILVRREDGQGLETVTRRIFLSGE